MYGGGFLNPRSPYQEGRCAYEVWEKGRAPTAHQCQRKNGHGPEGLFCKLHDPAAIDARQEEAMRRYREKIAGELRPHVALRYIGKLLDLVYARVPEKRRMVGRIRRELGGD